MPACTRAEGFLGQRVAETRHMELPSSGSALFRVGSRRWFLQAGMAGLGSLSLVPFWGSRLEGAAPADPPRGTDCKAVILFWLSGGPSHLDMWDPKPHAPQEIRGPFAPIATRIPGVQFCEHLPLQASIADQFSILRAVDCRASDHTPITMQAGNPLARRTNDGKDGDGYPSMGSIAAKFRGANDPDMPPFVGLANSWQADVWEQGQLDARFAPAKGLELAGKFALPAGISVDRLQDRARLRREFERFQRGFEGPGLQSQIEGHAEQAVNMVLSGKVQAAFDVEREPEALRQAYGRESLGEKALLARRLVEAGVTFVLVSGAWGYFDHHGDNVQWGGIEKGLKPLLSRVDRVFYTLINDLRQRGLLDSTLVLMLGEFGRSPVINKDAGRDHWTNVMSMLVAGGGLPHGQVIGGTDSRGAEIKDGRVRPQDLAATTFRHLGIDLESHWLNRQGRPTPIVTEGGRPIPELC